LGKGVKIGSNDRNYKYLGDGNRRGKTKKEATRGLLRMASVM